MGVSGGGGEPRWAFVVDVDAVELSLFIPAPGLGTASPVCRFEGPPDDSPGGGQYC